MVLTQEQAKAIELRDRDVFLEAGAGTGKTAVLVGRYCDAVTEDGVAPDSILAFTFTERAAGELRARIREELLSRSAAAGASGDAGWAGELASFAQDSERAWISTIHGFCRRLLASQPLEAGLDPRFRVLDAAESGRIAERAFDAALEELTVEREAATLVAAGLQVWRLRELVRTAYEQLRGQAVADPRLPAVLEPQAPAENGSGPTAQELAEIAESYDAVRELFEGFSRHYAAQKAARSGLDFEDLQLEALALLRTSEAARELWRGRFQHILVDEFQDTNRLQVGLIHALQGSETRLFVVGDELQSIYGFRHADIDAFRDERAAAAQAADSRCQVLPLSGSFRSEPDVIAAVNAIGTELLSRYRPLAAARRRDPEARGSEGPRVELLLNAAKGWDGEGIELTSATESGPANVAEARSLALRLADLVASGVPRGDIVVLLRAFTHVGAVEEALSRAGLAPHVVGGRGYWSHQQVEDVICLLSAIANPLDDEPLLGALSSPACGASADVLWLLRRIAGDRRHIWPALARCFGPKTEDEGSGPAKGVAGADAPAEWEQGSLFELPSGNGDVGEIDEQAERERNYLPLVPAEDRERLERFHGTLTELRERAAALPLDELCDRAVRDFGYDLATLARGGGNRRMANVRKLMRLAAEYESREGRDLRGFLDYAAGRAAAADAEGQAAVEAEGVDGVRIMTVHAAKGLEFPVVAVPDLGRDLLVGGRQADVRVGRVGERAGEPRFGLRLARPGEPTVTLGELAELADQEAAASSQEALRLAHVAFTRAEQRLILSGTFTEAQLSRPDEYPHGASVIARLLPALGVSGEDGQRIVVPPAPEAPGMNERFDPAEIVVRVSQPTPERASELALAGRGEAPGERLPPALLPPLAELRQAPAEQPLRPLSYSALSDYSRCGYRFYVERVLGLRPLEVDGAGIASKAPPSSRAHRLGFGNAVHRLLEWSARNRWAASGMEACAAALIDQGLPATEEEIARAREMVERWLDSELRRSLDVPLARIHPEASFLLGLGETVIRGQIDLLVELPGQPPLVVDYKTDAMEAADPEQRMQLYATQRDLYALAASEGTARRDGGESGAGVRTAYAFLDSAAAPLELAYDSGALSQARRRLEELVAGIRSGAFEVTEAPHRGLCLECPARERLCSHPPERTLADAATIPA